MLMDIIEARHSVRKYTQQQISRGDLELILKAGKQATGLGISSCIISRGEETFASPEGQELLKKWEVPQNYSAICFVILGYIDGEQPHTKPRRPGRVKIIGRPGGEHIGQNRKPISGYPEMSWYMKWLIVNRRSCRRFLVL